MATTHADRLANGQVYWPTYMPGDLAVRAERFILPNRRSEFIRRAIEEKVERLERETYDHDKAMAELDRLGHAAIEKLRARDRAAVQAELDRLAAR